MHGLTQKDHDLGLTPNPTGEIFDAEICEQYFPGSGFIAQVHRDSFTDYVFEHYVGEDANEEDWVEFITADSSGCDIIRECAGEVVFMNKETKEIVHTHETHVFTIDEVTVLYTDTDTESNFKTLTY